MTQQAKHTPERLYVLESNNSSLVHIEVEGTGASFATMTGGTKAERMEKALRLVDLWNGQVTV